MKSGDKKETLLRASGMLGDFRTYHARGLDALSLKDKTKVLAHLDSWAAHFTLKNIAKCASFLPEDKQSDMLLEMSSFDQISNVAELMMLHSPSYPFHRHNGQLPKLQAARMSAGKADESAKNKQIVEYAAQGRCIGEAKLLMQAGFIAGTTFDFTSDQVFGAAVVAKGVSCLVGDLNQSHLTFQPLRKNAIKVHVKDFPHQQVRVLELGKGVPPTYFQSCRRRCG